MIIAVLDDTGTHRGAKYCSCVGILAGLQHWKRFEVEWRKTLRDFGLTDFHAEPFYQRDKGQRVGEFRGWNDDKAYRLMAAMTALLGMMKARIVGTSVDVASFWSLPKRERAFLTGQMVNNKTGKGYLSGAPNKPFLLAFAAVLDQALAYSKNKSSLGIVLDNNPHLTKQASVICYQREKLFDESIKFLPSSRKDIVGLHLADEMAYLWNRLLTKGRLTKEQEFAWSRFSVKDSSMQLLNADGIAGLREKYSDVFDLF